MQSVIGAFTAESHASARKIASSVQVAWKKGLDPTIELFTVGVSLIGGNSIIAGLDDAPPAIAWQKYQYFNESDYLQQISYERGLNLPEGGIAKALFGFRLNNNAERFLPDYMGGVSELFTAVLPQRPIIINAGFEVNGVNSTIPQVVGLNRGNPLISRRNKTVDIEGADFVDFLDNRYVDSNSMFTGLRTDEVLANILGQLGYTTNEYNLDTGINLINFGVIPAGAKFSKIVDQLVRAEYGHLYQDEFGVIRFENRYHWNNSPHTEVQRIITTAEVLDHQTIGQHKIINTVEIRAEPRAKEPAQLVFGLGIPQLLEVGENEIFVDFEDPVLEITEESIVANDEIDDSGTVRTSNVSVKTTDKFVSTAKYTLINNHTSAVYLTKFDVKGRPARITREIFHRNVDQSSLTAYDPQILEINNDYIQSDEWAQTMSTMILEDFSEPQNIQEIEIRALPELQLGDLISWQGRYWRIFNIEAVIDPNVGFIQKLQVIKTTLTNYFQIGVSTIGGDAKISP